MLTLIVKVNAAPPCANTLLTLMNMVNICLPLTLIGRVTAPHWHRRGPLTLRNMVNTVLKGLSVRDTGR